MYWIGRRAINFFISSSQTPFRSARLFAGHTLHSVVRPLPGANAPLVCAGGPFFSNQPNSLTITVAAVAAAGEAA